MEISNVSSLLDQQTINSLVNSVLTELNTKLSNPSFQFSTPSCNLHLCLLNKLLKYKVDCLQEVDGLVEQYTRNLKNDQDNFSFQNGYSGLIFRLVELYENSKESKYLKKAFEYCGLIEHRALLNSKYVDDSLSQGRSGVLLMLIKLHLARPAEKLQTMIDAYFRAIIKNALPLHTGLSWEGPKASVEHQLPTLDKGLSGIAFVLTTLFRLTEWEAFAFVENRAWNHLENLLSQKEILEALSFHDESQIKQSGVAFAFRTKGKELIPEITGNSKLMAISTLKPRTDLGDSPLFKEGKEENNEANVYNLLLQLSLLEKHSVHPFFPYVDTSRKMSFKKSKWITLDEVKNVLLDRKYPKSSRYLNHKAELSMFSEGDNLELNPRLIKDHLRIQDKQEAQVITDLLDYEKRYWQQFIERYNNPETRAQYLNQLRARNKSLQIAHHTLLKKHYKVSESFRIYDVSSFNEKGQIIQDKVYWRETMTGMEEMPIGFLNYFLQLFENGAEVETAMLKMLLTCFCLSAKRFQPLIDFSESGSKENLIARIPFLFIYQVRLLVAEGILEEQKKPQNKLLKNLLLLASKGLGIYSKYENKVFEKRA